MTAPKKKKKPGPGKSTRASAARRRHLFIEAMLANGGNATQAAVKAGFSKNTAGSQGYDLLKRPDVATELARRHAELAARFEINTENVLRELSRIAYFDPSRCFDSKGKLKNIHKIDEDTRRAIASLEDGKIRAFSKTDAVKTAMNYLDMMPRRGVNVTANAQSIAAAEVSGLPTEKMSDYEKARRIAYALTKYGSNPPPDSAPPTDRPKEPA